MSDHHWLFTQNSGHDFSRRHFGKLSFYDTMRMIIGMGKGSTSDEIMDYLSNIWLNGIVISCLFLSGNSENKKTEGPVVGHIAFPGRTPLFWFHQSEHRYLFLMRTPPNRNRQTPAGKRSPVSPAPPQNRAGAFRQTGFPSPP